MSIKRAVIFIKGAMIFIKGAVIFMGKAIIFIDKGSLAIKGLFKIAKSKVVNNNKRVDRYNLK